MVVGRAGGAQYTSAGHLPAIWVPEKGAAQILQGGRGPLLGFRAEGAGISETVPFDPGDQIMMFTDGLIERRDESIDVGLQRLATALGQMRDLAPQDLCDALVEMCTSDGAPADDIAVLLVRRTQVA
jgi:serine phosphatase RsbU (regulator of sigma subunit)